jgi:hypothetical protein
LLRWFKNCETNKKKHAQFVVVVDSFNSERKLEKANWGGGGVQVLSGLCTTLSRPNKNKQLNNNLNKIDAHKGSLGFPDRQVAGKLGPPILAICPI